MDPSPGPTGYYSHPTRNVTIPILPNQLLFVIALVGMLLLCPAMVWVWNGPFFYARYAVPGIALSCPTKFSDSSFALRRRIRNRLFSTRKKKKKKKEWKCCDIWWRALMHTIDWTWTHWPFRDSLPAFFVSLSYQSFPISSPKSNRIDSLAANKRVEGS